MKKRSTQRESAFGFGPSTDLPSTRSAAYPVAEDPDDPTKDNDDFCSACGGIGRFLCCEGCPKSFHFTCSDPPYDEDNLPEGSWFCKSCRAKRVSNLRYALLGSADCILIVSAADYASRIIF